MLSRCFCIAVIFGAFLAGSRIFPMPSQLDKGSLATPLLAGIKIKSLHFSLPRPKEFPLTYGGAVLLEMEDAELPLVTLNLYFSNGLKDEPISQAGLLQSSAELLEIGGTKTKVGPAFNRALTRLGASLSVWWGREAWGIRLHVMRRNFSAAFDLLYELLLEAALPENQLQDVKNSLLVEIKKRDEKPEKTASRRLKELLYPGLRWGYSLQAEDVERISAESVRKEIFQRSNPKNMHITAVGDIKELGIKNHLDRLLFSLNKSRKKISPEKKEELSHEKFDLTALKNKNKNYRGKILLVEKEVPQAVIRIGAYLPPHRHPDFYALQTGNYVLGGGSFSSRLVRKIRAEEGLAYYVYSYNHFDKEDGLFRAGCGTRTSQTAKALRLLIEEIAAVQKKGLQEDEIHFAKEAILNSIVFQFDSPQKIAAQEMRFRLHKMPRDYMQNFPKKIRSVGQKDIFQAAARYWDMEGLYIVVVGPLSLKKDLEKIRPVIVKKPQQELF